MNSILDKKLIWWRDVPIDVEWGLLDYLSDVWNEKIYIIAANDYSIDRKVCVWENDCDDKVEFIIGDLDSAEHREKIDGLIHADAVHVFSGIKGGHRKYLDALLRLNQHNAVLLMESPSLYGSFFEKKIKNVLYPLMYGFYNKKYGKMFRAVITMGDHAKHIYASYGWDESKLYPFLYLPKIQTFSSFTKTEKATRALYIGRFEFATKGIHVLMKALEDLEPDQSWQVDFVGGYGNQKDEVISWCQQQNHVRYIGSWKSDTVVEKMRDYDFCIVPSLYDGWNMTPMQAINAGIGCVVSDHAGSQALIQNSGAGRVFQAGNISQLRDILSDAIRHDALRTEWKHKAISFQNKVSKTEVGNYFLQILFYCYGEKTDKPKCPWNEEK